MSQSTTLVALAGLVISLSGPAVIHAQQNSYADPLGTAMPTNDRPAELREARDLLTKDGTGLRLRAEVWVRVEPCPNKKPSANCTKPTQTQGRVFIGPVWEDRPIAGLEVEQLWLLHKSGVWSTRELKINPDHQIEFTGGPVLPSASPVDVVVKIRDLPGLLQIRYRTVYPRASAV